MKPHTRPRVWRAVGRRPTAGAGPARSVQQGGARRRRGPGPITLPLLSLLGVLVLPGPFTGVGWGQSAEYQVKAGFIYNLMRFTQWPKVAFHQSNDPLRVCVFGANPFGHYLDRIAGREVGGRPVAVDLPTMGGIDACHVLFISHLQQVDLDSLLDHIGGLPILTIGDMKGFAARGGAVNLVTQRGNVRLEVNPDAVKRAGLAMSSAVLQLATIVR